MTSREEIVEMLEGYLLIRSEGWVPRQLGQQRKIAQWMASGVERLLAAEREKVRERLVARNAICAEHFDHALEEDKGGMSWVHEGCPLCLVARIEAEHKSQIAKVRDQDIKAICLRCGTGEKPYLRWYGGKNWKGRHQMWTHNVHKDCHIVAEKCVGHAIRQLDLTAPSSTEEETND